LGTKKPEKNSWKMVRRPEEVGALFRYLQGKIKPVLGNRFCFNTLKTIRVEKWLVKKIKKV
jgi:hypothetical protein